MHLDLINYYINADKYNIFPCFQSVKILRVYAALKNENLEGFENLVL